MSCEHLICAACAGPVADGHCATCRAQRADFHQHGTPLNPQVLLVLAAIVALLAVVLVGRA